MLKLSGKHEAARILVATAAVEVLPWVLLIVTGLSTLDSILGYAIPVILDSTSTRSSIILSP